MFLFPETIQVIILDAESGQPVANIALKIHLSALQRNDYDFILPVTDANGIITVSQSWLTERMEGGINSLVADHTSALDDLYPRLEFEVLTEKEVEAAAEALSNRSQFGDNLAQIDELANALNCRYLPANLAVDLNDETELKVTIKIAPKPKS